MIEEWKSVAGYEGAYEISNLGRIKSLERVVIKDGFQMRKKERILKGSKDKAGYLRIQFSKNGQKNSHLSTHRLIAFYFLPNPENKPEVNHINGIKSDNRAINLEWATRGENQLHAYATGLKKPAKSTRPGRWNKRSKPVLQIFKDGTTREWEGIRRAAIGLGISPGNISRVLRGDFHKSGGFGWAYATKK